MPIRVLQREFRNGTRRMEGRLVGSTPEYLEVVRLRLADMPGKRFLTQLDVDEDRNYCVLAHEVAKELFPLGSPIGQRVMVDDEFYDVVGVANPRAPTAGVGGSLAAENFSADV